jgi:hypothetical protein
MLIEMQPGSGSLMRRFRGEWQLTALNASACRIDFTLSYELDGTVARVARSAFDRVADRLVDAFVQRADRLYPPAATFAATSTTTFACTFAAAVPAPAPVAPQGPEPHGPDLEQPR